MTDRLPDSRRRAPKTTSSRSRPATSEGQHIDDVDLEHLRSSRTHEQCWRLCDRFGCDLVRSPDGYFFLSPRGDRMGRRSLDAAEMLVGQTLCLLRLDPGMLRTSWRVARLRVLELLEQLVGAERLGQVLNPRRKRRSQAVEEEEIRKDVAGAIRTLARLGFVDVEADDQLRLRVPLLRFAEPVATQPCPERPWRLRSPSELPTNPTTRTMRRKECALSPMQLALVNWRGVFYETHVLDRRHRARGRKRRRQDHE